LSVFKLFRVVFLLSILAAIVYGTWLTEKQMASWDRPILVTVYPIAADGKRSTLEYARQLDRHSFRAVNDFLSQQAWPYGFEVTPAFRFQVAPVSTEPPPAVPQQFNTAAIAWWSLKMRAWSWLQARRDGLISADIQVFLLLHSINGLTEMGISVGMRKGRYGVIKAIAKKSHEPHNLVVFTHELMHVLGATDKYVLSTGDPIYPDGYADPDQIPLFPQRRAEIMGGAIPLSADSFSLPDSLHQCKIGRLTAREIGFWDKLSEF